MSTFSPFSVMFSQCEKWTSAGRFSLNHPASARSPASSQAGCSRPWSGPTLRLRGTGNFPAGYRPERRRARRPPTGSGEQPAYGTSRHKGSRAESRCPRRSTPELSALPPYVYSFFLTVGYFLADFERPVLGCIDADFCKQGLIFSIFRELHDLQTFAPLQSQNLLIFQKFAQNFGEFLRFLKFAKFC